MNITNGVSGSSGLWQTAKNPEGIFQDFSLAVATPDCLHLQFLNNLSYFIDTDSIINRTNLLL